MPNYRSQDEPVAGYKLIELLGEGAFGAVWKAEASGGVPVAMKIISKLNGIHAIREWQSLQAVKHLTHPNLVNIHGVWLRDENGHVLSTDEVRALIPAEAQQAAAVTGTESSQPHAGPLAATASRPRSSGQRQPKIDPRSTLRADTLQVGETPSSSPPRDASRSETNATPSGTDSGDGVPAVGSDGSAAAGSAGSRARWASVGDKVPPLELITAMTLGDGTMLDQLRRSQAADLKGIPRGELMECLRDAAKGLQYLNDADVYHCDIKPENLLVVGGSVQVCDYGSALRSIYVAEGLTNQGYTEPYAAPEQLSGKKIKVYRTTDLYALAITYYALRTGKFPWSDETDEPIAVIKHHERFDFSALAKMTRHRYEGDVLRRALKRDAKQRQKSVSDFLGELERAIAQEALAEAAARRRRRQIATWSAVAVVLLGLVGAGFYFREHLPSIGRDPDEQTLLKLLASNQWEAVPPLVRDSTELTLNVERANGTWELIRRELNSYSPADGQDRELEIARRAVMLSDKLPEQITAYLRDEILGGPESIIDKALLGKDYAGAAARSRQLHGHVFTGDNQEPAEVPQIPPEVHQSLQEQIYIAWLADAKTNEPVEAAVKLAEIATALPLVRERAGQQFVGHLQRGVQAAEEQLNAGAAADGPPLAEQCQRLAEAAKAFAETGNQTDETAKACRALGAEALVLGLGASVQGIFDKAAVRQQAAEAAGELGDSGSLLQARVELVQALAEEGELLAVPRLERLAALATALELGAPSSAARQAWDDVLYHRLLNETFDAAATRLTEKVGLTGGALAALRVLPAEGGADLRIARALVVRASRIDTKSDEATKAKEWLDNTKASFDPAAHRALESWLNLAAGKWFDPAQLNTTLASLGQWRAANAPVANEALRDLLVALVERAVKRVADEAGGFPADVSGAIDLVTGYLDAGGGLELGAVSPDGLQQSVKLRALRAKHVARSAGAADDLRVVQNDLERIATVQEALTKRLVSVQPDPELDALRVECYLVLDRPQEVPLAVLDAWQRLAATLGAADDTAATWDREYVGYVWELGQAAESPLPPPTGSGTPPTTSVFGPFDKVKSDWLKADLRKRMVGQTLVQRALKGLPTLPVSLKCDDADEAAKFAAVANELELARAWDSSGPAAAGLLAICRMHSASPSDWTAIRKLTAIATAAIAAADQAALAVLDQQQPQHWRLHLWLAHARASAAGAASDAQSRADAVSAYAAALRAGEFDLYGERGVFASLEASLACYDEIVLPARALMSEGMPVGSSSPLAGDLAYICGVQGALLEGDSTSRQLATKYFDFRNDPVKFLRGTRDAFDAAAQRETDPRLALRWLVGQARAADFLMSRGDEEQLNAEQFHQIAAQIHAHASWRDTFESRNLQALVHHYRSRREMTPSAKRAALEAAAVELNQALAAHAKHDRQGSPWCNGWLAQTYEELSRVCLEQSWLAPWGTQRQALLQQAVDFARQAADENKLPREQRLFPASCRFCAGNALEDFAKYLGCNGYLKDAQHEFESAIELAQSDAVWQWKTEVYLNRVKIKRAMSDPTVSGNKAERERYRNEAIAGLTEASRHLRLPKLNVLWLAREADFYVAEAQRSLFLLESTSRQPVNDRAMLREAEKGFRKLADEVGVGPSDRMNYLAEAAFCAQELATGTDDRVLRTEETQRCQQHVADLEAMLRTNDDPVRRINVVTLRFWLIDPTGKEPNHFAAKQRIALEQRSPLAGSSEPSAVVAQKRILLMLGRARCPTDAFAARANALDECRELLGKSASSLESATRDESFIELLRAEQILNLERAVKERPDNRPRFAKAALDKAEEIVERAGRMEADHQVTLQCTPDNQPAVAKARFNIAPMHLDARADSVYAAAAVATLQDDVAFQQEIRERVRKLWTVVWKGKPKKLNEFTAREGGPTADQLQKFNTFVGWN